VGAALSLLTTPSDDGPLPEPVKDTGLRHEPLDSRDRATAVKDRVSKIAQAIQLATAAYVELPSDRFHNIQTPTPR
jgi:hypothetical protein